MSSRFAALAYLKLSVAIVTTMLLLSPIFKRFVVLHFLAVAVGKDWHVMNKMHTAPLDGVGKLTAALQRASNLWALFKGEYTHLYAPKLHVSLSAWYNDKPPAYTLRGSVSWYSPLAGGFLQVWANADSLSGLLWELNRGMVKRARPDDYRARELEAHYADSLVLAEADKWRAAAAKARGISPEAVYMRGFDPSTGEDDVTVSVL